MRLSDLVDATRNPIWGEIGLLVFLGLFVAILVYTFSRKNRGRFDRARSLPLDDDPAPSEERPEHERF